MWLLTVFHLTGMKYQASISNCLSLYDTLPLHLAGLLNREIGATDSQSF